MALEDKFKDVDVVELAVTISNGIGASYYDLGEVLFYIKNSGIYQQVDGGIYTENNASWKRFCEDKLSVGYRTAQYWINIYEYFRAYFVDKETLAELGWAKAKAIVDSTDDQKELNAIIEFAKAHTVAEVEAFVANKKAKGLIDTLNTYRPFKFVLPAYQAEVVESAIALGKEVFGTDKDDEVLASILLDWTHIKAQEPIIDDILSE